MFVSFSTDVDLLLWEIICLWGVDVMYINSICVHFAACANCNVGQCTYNTGTSSAECNQGQCHVGYLLNSAKQCVGKKWLWPIFPCYLYILLMCIIYCTICILLVLHTNNCLPYRMSHWL